MGLCRLHHRFARYGRLARCLTTAILAVVACCMSVACRPAAPAEELGEMSDLRSLIDKFSSADPVVIVPDRFWESTEDRRAWVFRGYANLLCYVEQRPNDALRLIFEPTAETSGFHFTPTWDSQPLWPNPRPLTNPQEVFEIAADRLTPGLHRFELRRAAAAEGAAERSKRDNVFGAIAYGVGQDIHSLEPDDAERYEFIRAFFEDGVTGVGEEKHGGWLMSGPGTATATISPTEDCLASFDLVSFDSTPARFSVVVDDREHHVEVVDTSKRLEVKLPRGAHRLELSVQGPADGCYLWGAPHLRLVQPETVGPVIVVTLDTTRWDALSPYGGPANASPNIARLAERATVFENAWSTSPWTLPSHASIFTGLYPSHHGAGVTHPRLDRRFSTLAEIFRSSGYRTAGFAGGELVASRWGLAQGFEFYRDPEGFETRGDRLTAFTRDYLDGIAGDQFFLFVNYFDPHGLYQAPGEFEELFGVSELRKKIKNEPMWGDLSRGNSAVWRAIIAGEAEVTADAIAYLRAAYLAEVAFMDHQIGQLIAWLEQNELFDAATIVLVADHGEFLGEHGFFSHSCRLEPELTRVPLIIKWPYQEEARQEHSLVSQVDLFGTLAAVAGGVVTPGDGLSLDEALRSELSKRSTVFMEEHEMRIHPLFSNMKIAPSVFGIQQPTFRQVVWRGGTTCYRQRGRGWSETECAIDWAERMEQLGEFADRTIGDAGPVDERDLGDEMRRRLEALGYVR